MTDLVPLPTQGVPATVRERAPPATFKVQGVRDLFRIAGLAVRVLCALVLLLMIVEVPDYNLED